MTGFGETPLGLVSNIYNLAIVLTREGGLRVPRYQRAYTWTDHEVRKLIQDLWRAFQRRASFYFIGQIVLVKNDHGKFEITDGQQRLATLTMIVAYVRDRLPGRAAHFQQLIMNGENVRLELRKQERAFFRGHVQEPGQMHNLARQEKEQAETRDLLIDAAATIASELESVTDRELDGFMSYVARCCTLNVVDASERGCAQTVFDALNMISSPLSGADIIKSDLLENSDLTEEEAEAAALVWEEHESQFKREEFANLLEWMPFLLTGEQLIAPGDLAAFRGAIHRAGGIKHFLNDALPRYANALRDIFNCSVEVGSASDDVNRRLHVMKELPRWHWAPPAIAFLANHAHEHKRAGRFFRGLDRLAFANEINATDKRRQDKRYAEIVRNVHDDKALYGPGKPLELTPRERNLFIDQLDRPRPRDHMRRLLVFRIEAALPGGHLLTIRDNATIEHIMPAKGGHEWEQICPNKGERTKLANLLGNFTLLTQKQNEKAGNQGFAAKREIYFKTPGAPIHKLTEDIAEVKQWTREDIERRHDRLMNVLCRDWGLVGEEGGRR